MLKVYSVMCLLDNEWHGSSYSNSSSIVVVVAAVENYSIVRYLNIIKWMFYRDAYRYKGSQTLLSERFWRTFKYTHLRGFVNRRIDDLVQKICDLKNFFQLKLSQQDFTPHREYALKIHQRMMRGLLMLKQQDCYKLVGKESDSEFAIFVKSSSSPDKNYLVTIIPPNAKSKDAGSASCTCLDSVPILCKHIHLAIHVSGKSY